MLLLILLAVLVVQAMGQIAHTHGEVWPKAHNEKKGNEVFSINLDKFEFKPPNNACNLVQKAIDRCKRDIQILINIARKNRSFKKQFVNQYAQNELKELQIHLMSPCSDDMYPQFGMDESYNLTVAAKSVLSSSTIWGLIRGLETFSQLFYMTKDYTDVAINATTIEDRPHYLHRGLMLDTSRHYISVENILKLLDAMAMNKMNVFHWHIVDDESYPYVSGKFPELSEKGAYFRTLTYNRSDVVTIRDHARDLGIRVVVEIDMPGHSRSVGKSHPEIIVKCDNNNLPMNPIKDETYNFLRDLLQDAQGLFRDNYQHLGGDETQFQCWTGNAEIRKFMKDHNMSAKDLLKYFFKSVIPLLKEGTVPMVWEDVFTKGVPLDRNTVIHVWYPYEDGVPTMVNVLKNGYYGVQSVGFYLDYAVDFVGMYKNEIRLKVKKQLNNDTLLQNLIGGEACMWGEMMDDSNLFSRVWPRASAVAEVLWSETEGYVPEHVLYRIEEHTCRMVRRGIPAEPAYGAGYCVI